MKEEWWHGCFECNMWVIWGNLSAWQWLFWSWVAWLMLHNMTDQILEESLLVGNLRTLLNRTLCRIKVYTYSCFFNSNEINVRQFLTFWEAYEGKGMWCLCTNRKKKLTDVFLYFLYIFKLAHIYLVKQNTTFLFLFFSVYFLSAFHTLFAIGLFFKL